MKKIYSNIIQFRGSHYDFGVMQGNQIKDSLIIKNRAKQWRLKNPRITVNEQEVKSALISVAPGIWEELIGLQDALKWPITEVLRSFGGYHLDYVRSGCSIFTDREYMIRNYDFHPNTYEGRYILYQPTDQGYATIGPSQNITGRMDGMNEQGLSIGYNAIHNKNPEVGFISNMVARIVLENCSSVNEALAMLKEIPHRHSFSYVLLDENEETYVVEASPRGIEIHQSNICTNHFDILTEENRHHLDDSIRRFTAIDQQKNTVKDIDGAFSMLNDPNKGVFSKNYRSSAGTIHTTAYLPKQKQAWIALGENKRPSIFSFQDWLQGEDIGTEKINGEIDTDELFLHMEKM